MTEVILDSFSESNQNDDQGIRDIHPSSTTVSACGQTFTTPSTPTYKVTSAKFYLKKYGSPIGHLRVCIYAITGTSGIDGKPTGSALATSDLYDVSGLTTSYALITFTFSGDQQTPLTVSTNYCVDIEVADATTWELFDYVDVGVNYSPISPNPNDDGNFFDYYSVWGLNGNLATCFYVYGTLYVATRIKTDSIDVLFKKLGLSPQIERTVNGGFEDGNLTGWTYLGNIAGVNIETDPSKVHSGTYSLRLNAETDTSPPYEDYACGIINLFNLTSYGLDQIAKFGAWILNPNGTMHVHFLYMYYKNGILIQGEFSQTISQTVGWHYIDVLSLLISDVASHGGILSGGFVQWVDFNSGQHLSDGYCWVDDITFMTYYQPSIDVSLQMAGIKKTDSISSMLKKLKVTKTDSIDVMFKKFGYIGATYNLGVLTGKRGLIVSEQFVTNGGFETGDWTGWTHYLGSSIVTSPVHTGLYAAYVEHSYAILIGQTCANIKVSDISLFESWILTNGNTVEILIEYSDGNNTTIFYTGGTGWEKINFLSYIPSGYKNKYVNGIYFVYDNGPFYVDDVSLEHSYPQLDVVLANRRVKIAQLSVLFRLLKITVIDSVDVFLGKMGLTEYDSIDVMLKKMEATITNSIQVLFKRKNVIFPLTTDVLFAILETETDSIDTILGKLGVTYTNSIDVLLKGLGIEKTDSIDILFQKLIIGECVEYENQDVTAGTIYGYVFGDQWYAQTFTPTETHDISMINLFLQTTGNLQGKTFTVEIYNVDALGFPTGSPLTSKSVDASLLFAPFSWKLFEVPIITLNVGVMYAIAVHLSGGDFYHEVMWQYNPNTPLSDGYYCRSNDAGATWGRGPSGLYDFQFEIWKVRPPYYGLSVVLKNP